jgi:hypothetical protein
MILLSICRQQYYLMKTFLLIKVFALLRSWFVREIRPVNRVDQRIQEEKLGFSTIF